MTRVVNCKKEPYDVYIGRPGYWGNPFVIRTGDPEEHDDGQRVYVDTREEAIEGYRLYLETRPDIVEAAKKELKGRVLGCWCKPEACHGDVLAELCDAA